MRKNFRYIMSYDWLWKIPFRDLGNCSVEVFEKNHKRTATSEKMMFRKKISICWVESELRATISNCVPNGISKTLRPKILKKIIDILRAVVRKPPVEFSDTTTRFKVTALVFPIPFVKPNKYHLNRFFPIFPNFRAMKLTNRRANVRNDSPR